jgi:peptide/nickel transport system substrate-binding protein
VLTDEGYKINTTGKTLQLVDPKGKPVPALKFMYTVGNTDRATSAQLVQDDLAKIGITVNVFATKQFGPDLVNGNYDITEFAWTGAPFPSAGAFQEFTPQGGSDYCNYNNPKAVNLIVQATHQTNPAAANDLLNQADKIMVEDNVIMPLFQKPMFLATGVNVIGIRPNGTQSGPAYNVAEWGLRSNNSVQ